MRCDSYPVIRCDKMKKKKKRFIVKRRVHGVICVRGLVKIVLWGVGNTCGLLSVLCVLCVCVGGSGCG